jgi:hypothetical protein
MTTEYFKQALEEFRCHGAFDLCCHVSRATYSSVSTAVWSDSSTKTLQKDSVVSSVGHRDDGQCAVPLLRGALKTKRPAMRLGGFV